MLRYGTLFKCVSSKAAKDYWVSQCIESTRFASTFSRTDVTIPVSITGGHVAAQLWQGTKSSSSPSQTPLICMHGVQDNSCSFDPLIPLIIKDNMTILTVDQLGHGFSSHTAGAGYDILLDGVATIHRIMRHYNWDKVSLLGHSFGSILSFIFSTTNPDKVDKYVAIENIHVIEREIFKVFQRTYKILFDVENKLTNPKIQQPSYSYEDLFQRVRKARKGAVTDEGINTLLKRGAAPDPDNPNLLRFTHDLKTTIPSQFSRISFEQSLELAKNIRCDVCVIKGDPGEDYEPRERFMKMVDTIRESNNGKFEFHLVPGTHHLHLNEPQCVAPIISKFLDN